jgi:hypothetical protein
MHSVRHVNGDGQKSSRGIEGGRFLKLGSRTDAGSRAQAALTLALAYVERFDAAVLSRKRMSVSASRLLLD